MSEVSSPLFLTEDIVRQHLKWDKLVPVIERAIAAVSCNNEIIVQPARTIMPVPGKDGVLLTMPSFNGVDNALGCKLVTSFKNNREFVLPTILATVLLFDIETGQLLTIMEGNHLTAWRTAAASVVATKYLHNGTDILAVLGSGAQARSHIQALDHFFNFKEIRIWNHRQAGAIKLALEFEKEGKSVKVCSNAEDCVKDADIIVTATYAQSPILKAQWIKPGVHINAIGAGSTHHSEIDTDLYKISTIFTDTMAAAKSELCGLEEIGVTIQGEIGEVINGTRNAPRENITIFHSLGMAVEDVATAKLVYDQYKKIND